MMDACQAADWAAAAGDGPQNVLFLVCLVRSLERLRHAGDHLHSKINEDGSGGEGRVGSNG